MVKKFFTVFLFFVPFVISATAKDKCEKKGLYCLPRISQTDFNRLAQMSGIPVFWAEDSKNEGILDPGELVILGADEKTEKWISKGKFTAGFESAYRKIIDMKRDETVREELNQGIPTLVQTDFSNADPKDKEFVKQMLKIGKMIEELHMKQRGSFHLIGKIKNTVGPAKALFERNQGPWCYAPKTEKDSFCNAFPDF
ncbi:MAG: hypothetical protein N3B13_10625, partial [Deltaproteobacteria bacterium]|nr:hypothetical protein [Deltaproteobacteria bacterium]